MVWSFCTTMENVAYIRALQGHFLSFMQWFPQILRSQTTALQVSMWWKNVYWKYYEKRSKLKKRCFKLPLKKQYGTTGEFSITAMLHNIPAFIMWVLVQHTASRVKMVEARGILQSVVSGSRGLSLAGFLNIPSRSKGLIKTTHPVNISLTPYIYCEFNWTSHYICVD